MLAYICYCGVHAGYMRYTQAPGVHVGYMRQPYTNKYRDTESAVPIPCNPADPHFGPLVFCIVRLGPLLQALHQSRLLLLRCHRLLASSSYRELPRATESY